MSKNGQKETKPEHGHREQPSHGDRAQSGHSGEGAASALAHLISQGEQPWRQSTDAEDASGSGRP
jgi:hypothetical protein